MKLKPKGFSIGDTVLVADTLKQAVIEAFLSDIRGGVRLDREVQGLRFWNVQELKVIRKGKFGAACEAKR